MDENKEKILRLIHKISDEEDDERRSYLADCILEIDPGNPIAKYVKWQCMDDEESARDMSLVREAIASLRPVVDGPDELDGEEVIMAFYISMLSDLASFLYATGEKDEAFAAASEFMERDDECGTLGRLVYYAILVEQGKFAEVIEAVENDICETPAGEFCRAIAAFELEGCKDSAAEYLLNAFSLDPDLPFYILGVWAIDDESIDDEENYDGYVEETMVTVSVMSELWAANEDRLAFLSVVAFSIGYITGRMEDADEMETLEESYKEAGCLEDIRESRDVLHAMLAGGKSQEEVDEEALSIFRETNYFNLFE
ncbi:MAG: hypothetical protein LBQ36_05165 [Synergistaceae bacterium]|nr:hypothetical protein [Synergistaceae bacterium]